MKDAVVLADVFFRSVREGPSPYTEAQRAAWLPRKPSPEQFAKRIGGMHVVVAEDERRIVGFMGMMADGLIDLTFIVPEARGRGVFTSLYRMIEMQARSEGLATLRVYASLMAQPAFQAMDFSVVKHQIIECGGEKLPRAEMEKYLT